MLPTWSIFVSLPPASALFIILICMKSDPLCFGKVDGQAEDEEECQQGDHQLNCHLGSGAEDDDDMTTDKQGM